MSFQKQDNRYKWHLRDALLNKLYGKLQKQMWADMAAIVDANCHLINNTHRSVLYKGVWHNFSFDTAGPPIRNRLHSSLVSTMEAHLAFYDPIFQLEKVLIKGYFTSMLSFSQSLADYQMLLPDSLHDVLRTAVISEEGHWVRIRSDAECQAFMTKHQKNYELIRARMAFNLISE